MREARRTGRGVCRFDRALQDRATYHLKVEHDLWHALERDELVVHYQPLVELASRAHRRGRGARSLAPSRARHDRAAGVHPDRRADRADRADRRLRAGSRVPSGRGWRDAGHPLRVSVNVAVAQLRDPTPRRGRRACVLSHAGLPPDLLCLEITESVAARAPPERLRGTRGAAALGVRIAIDDFGTGYSSLTYLHQLPGRRAQDRPLVRQPASARLRATGPRRGDHRHGAALA